MPKSGRVGKRQGSHSSFLILPFTKKETQVVMVKYVLVHCSLALGSQLDKPKFSDNGASCSGTFKTGKLGTWKRAFDNDTVGNKYLKKS